MALWSRIGAGLAAAVLSVTVAASAGVPASAAQRVEYINLGDSYSAGSGVLPMAPGVTTQCAQSADNFAKLIARQYRYRLTDVSCGGASTSAFTSSQYAGVAPQFDALTSTADLITLSIGGNDGNIFASTVAKCVTAAIGNPGKIHPCQDAHGSSIADQIDRDIYPKIRNALKTIRAKAPRAQVAILAYPWIVPARAQTCPGFPVAPGDVVYTRGIQKTLNSAIARAAAETGAVFVDTASASEGHDSCQPVGVRWVEPLLSTVQPVPVHPNALGERQMARVTAQTLRLG